ncbi:hypothetical protein YC2023_101586 [Brassica napus]
MPTFDLLGECPPILNISGVVIQRRRLVPLGLMREKDIDEQRLKINSCIASPFQKIDRLYFAVSKDTAGNVTEDNIKDAISWYKQALGFHVEAGHGNKRNFEFSCQHIQKICHRKFPTDNSYTDPNMLQAKK